VNKRWTQRPEGSTWGDWGQDDQLGRLNLIGPEQVKKGIAEVREGKTFSLSLPLDYPGGQVINKVRFPPVLKPVIRNGEPYFNYLWSKINPNHTDIGSDDAVLLHTQYSTQWDSLAHRGSVFDVHGNGEPVPVYYNGFSAGEDIEFNGESSCARALGIEHMAAHGVQGRAVLVDLYSRFGRFPRKEVGYDDLMEAMEKQKAEVEQGDILCIWTGLDTMIMEMKGTPDTTLNEACAVLDGWDDRLLNWISDSGIAAIASDNLAVEAVGKQLPEGKKGSTLPLHEHCLFKIGIHLGELWYLVELAEFLRSKNEIASC
jgi:hypothetical protein